MKVQSRKATLAKASLGFSFAMASVALSKPAFADVISGPGQINPSTSISQGDPGFPISEIADDVSAANITNNGFVGGDNEIGPIVLDLDQEYDLTAFYLWNDIVVVGESISQFDLEFFNNGNSIGTYVPAGLVPINRPNVQTFTFPEVKNVDRVVVHVRSIRNSSFDRVEVREMALEGEVSDPTSITCCPPSNDSALLIEQFDEVALGPKVTAPTKLKWSPSTSFNQQMQWTINLLHAQNPQVTKLVIAVRLYDETSGNGVLVGSPAYVIWEPDLTGSNANGTPAAGGGFFSAALPNNNKYAIHVETAVEGPNGALSSISISQDCKNSGFFYGDTANPTARQARGSRGFATQDGKPYKRKRAKRVLRRGR